MSIKTNICVGPMILPYIILHVLHNPGGIQEWNKCLNLYIVA